MAEDGSGDRVAMAGRAGPGDLCECAKCVLKTCSWNGRAVLKFSS